MTQRIRQATHIGECLAWVLHMLEEPNIELGTLEKNRLHNTLMRLRDLDKTLIKLADEES